VGSELDLNVKSQRLMRLAGMLAAMVLFPVGEVLAQDVFVLAGRVIEQADGSPVAAATVELPGRTPVLTNASGDFRFTGVPFGRYTLTVEALGYRSEVVELILRADTSITVELEIQPVTLDSVEARVRYVTFRGNVVEASTQKPVFDADVYLGLDDRTTTNSSGGFRFRRVPAQAPTTLEVRALGFMPEQRVIEAADDTTLVFGLEPDNIARRMIENQLARLEDRMQTVPYSTMLLTREDIERYPNWSGRELVESRVPIRRVVCLVVDETVRGIEPLSSYMPEEIARIEILRNRMSSLDVTVRLYTRRYLQRMVSGGIQLQDLPTSRTDRCR
jgi:hypothetical protein